MQRLQSDDVAARPWLGVVVRTASVLIPIGVWFWPYPPEPVTRHAFAVAAFMLLAWITEAFDHALTGLIGCFLFWVLRVSPFGVAFSGFANDVPWFLFGALLFGAMATKSGIARRLAYLILRRVGSSVSRILLGLILTDFVLTFIVPSGTARIVIMASIALGLIEAFGVRRGSNIGRGMFIIITYTAVLFDKMIIAGAASVTARGIIERVGGVEVLWSRWFLAYLPCDLITILVAWRLILWLYPPESIQLSGTDAHVNAALEQMGDWTGAERKAAMLMLLAIGLWMTDFIHHIPAAAVGLGIGLCTLLPGLGVLDIDDLKQLNLLPFFFVAAAVSMGEVLTATGGITLLTSATLTWMEPLVTNVFSSTLILYWTAFVYHLLLASDISMLATSLPLLMTFAKTQGLDPLSLGMIWTFAAGGKIFMYQAAVLIVGYSYGYFGSRDMLKVGICLTIVESLILLLLVPFYWPLIGLG